MVRATLGRRSGPITISATMPISRSSEKAMSNMCLAVTPWEEMRSMRPGRSGRNQTLVFSLTSPSMVWPPAEDSILGIFSSSFAASLKLFTAPPRSPPMLRSFLVPKITSTITSTISQCQMLNEPILPLLKKTNVAGHPRGSCSRARNAFAADYMDMQMEHVLPTAAASIDHSANPVGQTLLLRQLRRKQQRSEERAVVALVAVRQRIHMLLGDDHEVHPRDRVDVVKRQHLVIFVHLPAGNFTGHDFAEYAVAHASPHGSEERDAFSARPETPSRRASSASTSSGWIPCCASS